MRLVEKTWHLLRTYGIVPNRLLGQNFLVDAAIFQRLVDYASVNQTETVLDVGAGFGFLTCFLATKCGCVIAVEKDPRVASALIDQVSGERKITIIGGDVLTAELPHFDKVVSVPPYQISSQLLIWLFQRHFKRAVLVLQKEFADRLTAQIGTEDYSWMTVFAYYYATAESLELVPRQMFFPEPKVDSAIVRLIPRPKPVFHVADLCLFRKMLKSVFAERNKKLANATLPFAKTILNLSAEEVKLRLGQLRFRDQRVRTLPPEAFGEVARVLIR